MKFLKPLDLNENNESISTEIEVLGESSDNAISVNKAKANAIKLTKILSVPSNYKIVNSNTIEKDGKFITKIIIRLNLTSNKIQAFKNMTDKYSNAPYKIIS